METGLIVPSTSALTPPTAALTVAPVRVIENLNPFRFDQRNTYSITPLENESAAALATRAADEADESLDPDHYIFSVNGKRIPDAEIWATAVKPGQEIVLYPRAAGGGFGRMLESLFIIVTAAVIGFIILGPFGAGIGAAIGAIVAGFILAPGTPRTVWSATYDPTGPKGLAQPGVPVPKAAGTMGWCGNIVSSYVDYAGNNAFINVLVCYGWGAAKSISSILINGKPISSFQNCQHQTRLGTNTQTPIDGFDKTVNGFPQEIDLLVSGGAVVVPGTGTNVQGLEITVKFPAGLYCITNDGNYVTAHFIYKIEYAAHGSSEWVSPLFPNANHTNTVAVFHEDGSITWPAWVVVPTDRFAGSGLVYDSDNGSHTPGDVWTATETITITNIDGSTTDTSATFTGKWEPCDPNLNPVKCNAWYQGYIDAHAYTLSPTFDTQVIYGLTAGQWDVRVTKIGYFQDQHSIIYGDSTDAKHVTDGWLWNINEVFWSNLSYPNMILLGIKALATSQMSGADIQVQATIVHDIGVDTVLPAALTSFEHDNPAIVAYDVLTNSLYGMGVAAANIDVPAFVAWANFCDETVTNQDGTTARRFMFAGVFDQTGDAWKTLQAIGGMSQAMIIPIGLRYTVVLDAPADPVQLFTVGNVKKDSFQEMWVALDDRTTLIECDFADAARNYRMDLPVSVMTAADINSGIQPKVTRTKLLGCTSRDQAWRLAYFHLLATKLTLRSIRFEAALEGVCCQIGSVIGMQSDVVQWAAGGRVQAGSTSVTVSVDRADLTFAGASGWTVSVQHPVVQRGMGTISAIAGLIVTMTGALPSGRILKAVGPDGTEYVVTNYGGSAVTLARSVGTLAAGQVLTFYDVNVIDTLDVTAMAVTASGATLTVAGSFSAVPVADSAWVYGQSAGTQPAKLFRVTSIKKSGDFDLEITAIEYNAAMYDDVIPNYGEIVGVPTGAPAIINLSLTEQFQNGLTTGSSNSALIAVGWQNANTAIGARVRLLAVPAVSGSAPANTWTNLGNITGTGCSFVGYIGTTYEVEVTALDWQGNLFGNPVMASITVVAATNAPANVTGFTGAVGASTVLTWNPIAGIDHYEIRFAASAATDWNSAPVLWDGTATTWTDTTLRSGTYMIVAVSSLATGSVESVTPATWQPAAGTGGTGATTGSMTIGTPTWSDGDATIPAPTGTVENSSGTLVTLLAGDLTAYYAPTGPGTLFAYAYINSAGSLTWPSGYSGLYTAPNSAASAAAQSSGIASFVIRFGFGSGGTFISASMMQTS